MLLLLSSVLPDTPEDSNVFFIGGTCSGVANEVDVGASAIAGAAC